MTRAEQPTVVTPTSGALAADSRERAVRALLRFPPLKRLWSAQFVGGIGDALSMLVLVLLALQAALYVPLGGEAAFGGGYRGAALAVTAVFAARMLAMLLFGAVLLGPLSALTSPAARRAGGPPSAGPLDRRWTMIGADVLRLALLVIAPLWLGWTPDNALAWLLVTVFVTGVAERFWTVARESAAPGLLPTPPPDGATVRPLPDNMDALRRLSLRTSFVSLPIAAAALVVVTLVSKLLGTGIDWFRLHQAALGSYVAAGLFAASVSILYFIEFPGVPTPRPRSPLEGLRRPKAAAAAAGQPAQGEKAENGTARTAADKGRTGAIPLLVAACAAVAAALAAAVSLAVLHGYDLSGGPAAYALLVLALTGGTAVGIRGAHRVLPTLSRRRLLALAVAATGLALLAMGLVPDQTTVLLLALLAGISAGIAANTGHVLLDQESEEPRAARTTEHLHAVVRLSIAAAVIVAPLLAAVIGPHHLGDGAFNFAYGGAAYTLMLAGALLLPVAALVLGKADDRQGVPLRSDLWEALRGADPAQAPAPTGFFIALEGGDGAGKSTQVEALAEWIRGKGHEVVVTREPGATAIGKRLRSIILDVSTSGLSDRAEALMFAADRAEHVNSVIRPALERGAVVITDRYIDSSVAYQGAGRNLAPTEIARISRWATDGLVPHLTVLLDVSPETARERFTEAPDRLESEPAAFHQRVRCGFLTLAAADPARYLVVDAGQEPEAVTTVVRHRLDQVLPLSETEVQAQAEARKAAEEEVRRKAEEEAAHKAEEERLERERQEQLAKLRAEEEERKRRDAEEARAREEAHQADEARKRAEEARQAAEAERARREAEERARQAEQERLRKQHEEEARLRKEAEERRLEKQRKAEAALVRAEEARKAAAESAAAAEAKAAAEAAQAAEAADAPTAETYVADLRKRLGGTSDDASASGSDGERTEESLPRPGTPDAPGSRAADETAVLPPVRDTQDPWHGLDTGADPEETAVLPPVRDAEETAVLPSVRDDQARGEHARSGDPADRVPPWMFRKETPDAAAGRNGAASAPAESRAERTRELPQIDPETGHPVEIPQRARPRPEWAEETPLDDLPTLADELLGSRADEDADGRGGNGRRGGRGRRG
ncbi:dTMP kinase [Streptomyces platensis]|uniref:dTMP kinase n=1 Tax=Streptomyces platensis TaxID=58346 RepID=UPI0022579CA9|nr:dTMP kinase [Streptomyces platensis]MCX4639706.1 dTMP kinase [Streptomyces platensis]